MDPCWIQPSYGWFNSHIGECDNVTLGLCHTLNKQHSGSADQPLLLNIGLFPCNTLRITVKNVNTVVDTPQGQCKCLATQSTQRCPSHLHVHHYCTSSWRANSLPKDYFGQRVPSPPTQWPLQLQRLTLYSSTYSTLARQVNRDSSHSCSSHRIPAMFSLAKRCSKYTAGQNCATIQSYFLLSVWNYISKCSGLTLIMFSLIVPIF